MGSNTHVSDIKCIDFGAIASKFSADEETNEEAWLKVGKEVAKSFNDIGFAYIRNHGIPQHVIDEAHEVGAKFFELSDDIKSKYSKAVSMKQGYVEINREKLHKGENIQEIRESYDVRDINGIFPSEVDNFQSAISQLIDHGKRMSYKLLRCLEIGLNLPKGTFLTAHKNPFSDTNGSLLRILYYPPIPPEIKEGAIRCGAHSDYGIFTLLFQDNMGGLEVKNRDGRWVKANPIPGTVLINVGDLLQMWTGGKFVATKHRVLVPEDEVKQRCVRRSIVLFFHPDDEVLVKPLDGSSTYPPIKAGQHNINRYSETYKF